MSDHDDACDFCQAESPKRQTLYVQAASMGVSPGVKGSVRLTVRVEVCDACRRRVSIMRWWAVGIAITLLGGMLAWLFLFMWLAVTLGMNDTVGARLVAMLLAALPVSVPLVACILAHRRVLWSILDPSPDAELWHWLSEHTPEVPMLLRWRQIRIYPNVGANTRVVDIDSAYDTAEAIHVMQP